MSYFIEVHPNKVLNYQMALNLTAASLHPKHSCYVSLSSKHKYFCNVYYFSSSCCFKASATEPENTEEDPSAISGASSSSRTQLHLLQQLSSSRTLVDGYDTDGTPRKLTIREQLAQLVPGRDDDFVIPLGQKNLKKVSPKFLTTSQKRNIKRQDYLNEVSQRNDSVFFATIGAFVILPPVVILGIAILTGYVQLLP